MTSRPPYGFNQRYTETQLNVALKANFDWLQGTLDALSSVDLGLSSSTPLMDGVAAVGTETLAAHGDHVHPTDTSRLSATASVGGDLTGNMPNPKVKFLAVNKWAVD